MARKIPCEIRTITLDDATYKGTGVSISPTYINYLFGSNGSGKSTLAKALKTDAGVTYAPGKTAADYLPLVYDQEFIDTNMHSYHSLPGVFTINETNVEVQEQIDKKLNEQATAKKKSTDAATEKGKKVTAQDDLLKQLYRDCWDKTITLRESFDKTQDGKKKSKQFTEEVQRHSPVEHDLEALTRMYDSVYSDTARHYDPFSTINDTTVLENIEGSDILALAIVNTSNTPFADFLKEIGASEGMRQAHEEYHAIAGDRCPYCSRKLPDDFEKTLADSFDDQYQKNRDKLDAFLTAYQQAANDLFVPLSKTPAELYPAIDIKPYTDKLAAVKAIITANIDKIKEKIAEPSKIVTLDDTNAPLQELSDIITGFNKLINANNAIVAAGPRKKTECKDNVFEHIAFVLKDVLEAYSRSAAALTTEINAQQKIIDDQKKILDQIEEDLKALNSQTVETETAMKSINRMLRDSGFQGFELRPHPVTIIKAGGEQEIFIPSPPLNYEVVRTDTGLVAENLSEGEKNFIAFMYFQQLVLGSESSEGETRDKIVVIDDPVSSMDSSALFIVSAQVRRMIEICRNNADNRNPLVPGNFIKQIFILTHNAYFHREVTYPYANRYEFVSFYLIRKIENQSSIRLCEKINPDAPTERVNINPVKNSYAALWEEYKELQSGVPLMNVIRRILEYYFLQLCGYEGNDLRQRILIEHKEELTHDEHGNEDRSKFETASAMLSYIANSSTGVNDGINFIDDVIDPALCRETFEMIFREMKQGQHFDMMMGNK